MWHILESNTTELTIIWPTLAQLLECFLTHPGMTCSTEKKKRAQIGHKFILDWDIWWIDVVWNRLVYHVP